MFSYFGNKSKLIHKYSKPKFDTIVEPFAGSARYSCVYGLERQVWLNDAYPVVCRIWEYLKNATRQDIISLPSLSKGDDLREIKSLSEVERELLGFAVGRCRNTPGNVYTGWAARDDEIERTKVRLLPLIGNISHWKITCCDYRKVRLKDAATYFVDPPYQNRKSDYAVDDKSPNFYKQVSLYCRNRAGQVIVCEDSNADWMDFNPLATISGQRRVSAEVVCELEN